MKVNLNDLRLADPNPRQNHAGQPVPSSHTPTPCGDRTGKPNPIAATPVRFVPVGKLPPAEAVDWIWPGYVAAGAITLLTGLWKAGKTTLLGHLLRDLYAGRGLVDSAIDGPTLVFSEEPESLWSTRRDTLGLSDHVLIAQRETFVRPTFDGWKAMIASVVRTIEASKAALVVFDTLPSLWPVVNENDASEVVEALAPLRDLNRAGAAVLLVHHPRKGEGGQAQASRGSGALPGFVDVIVELRRSNPEDSADKRRKLNAYGRYEGVPAEVVVELGPRGYTMLGDTTGVRAADIMDTIEGLLPETGAGHNFDHIMGNWPTSDRPGRTRLKGLLNQGTIEGRWLRVGTGIKGDAYAYVRGVSASGSASDEPPS